MKGIIPVVVTPFSVEGKIDLHSQLNLIDY